MIIELNVRPASEEPKPEDWTKEAIIFNKCDGYHVAHHIMFYEDSSFDAFYDFTMNRFNKEFYTSWALLPDELMIE